jgi:hypothetical protein
VAADVAIFTQRSGGNHQMVRNSVLKEYLRLFLKQKISFLNAWPFKFIFSVIVFNA